MWERDDEREIARFRAEIDRIDTRLVELINERARHAVGIGRAKRRNNQPVHVPNREEEVMRRVAAHNRGPLSQESIQAVFRSIMEQTRKLEETGDGDSS